MKKLFLHAVVFLSLFSGLIPSGKAEEILFPSFREKVKSIVPCSKEDYALGAELMVEIRKLAAEKKPAVPAPIISFETLSSAGRMWYTDHNYTDRQLFCSRDIWKSFPSQFQQESHRKTYEIFDMYGIETFNFYVYGEHARRYYESVPIFSPNRKIIPTVTPAGYNGKLSPEILKIVGSSPHTMRLDGKILYLCWTWVDIPQTKEFIKKLEEMTGQPAAFIYSCGTVNKSGVADPFNPYINDQGVPATSLLIWFDYLTEVLEFCAGIEYSNYLTEHDGRLCARYYHEIIMPLFAAVCAQKKYNGKKLCGLEILTGYNNYRGRQRLSADGTKTLRSYLDIAKKFNLDILKAFEWDEYNEDSHFQPTVNKPMAYQRILKFWNDSNNHRPLSPNPGDDLSLPNLILSHRKQLQGGPDHELEILHVPDTGRQENYSVLAEILDENGKVLLTKELKFNTAELKEYTLTLPGRDYIHANALITRLTIDYQGKKRVIQEGLPFTVVRPTVTNDQTWYSTPLRNVLFPKSAGVKFGKAENPAGALPERIEISAAADLNFPDPLSSVEIIQDGRDNRYSFDPANEFFQNDPEWMNLILSFYRLEFLPGSKFDISMEMKNAPDAVWFQAPKDPKMPYLGNVSVKEESFRFTENPEIKNLGASSWRVARVIALKKADFDKAVFVIKGTYTTGPDKGKTFEWSLPLAELKDTGVSNFIQENGLQIALEIPQRFDRLPLPVMDNKAKFQTTLHTGYHKGVFAVRAVSRTGKVWWSAPHNIALPPSGKKTEISVFCNKNGAYDLAVDSSRVPHIQYRFDPSIAGNILTTAAGREFYGNIGGYDLVPTGYEGYHCSVYSIPYSFRYQSKAGDGRKVLPQYEKLADGSYCLNFTGNGEFIGFPPSLFPQRAGYTVKFEFMPLDVDNDQVYFVHAEHDIAGFRLRTEDYRLVLDFYRRQAGKAKNGKQSAEANARDTRTVFKTNLDPVEGKWNKIEFKYDMEKVYITLNGKTESFPCTGLSRWFAVGGFGGDGTKNQNGARHYFKGKLKSFEVIHSAK